MKEIKTEIVINAPASVVWDVLMDFKAYPEWNPFVISIEPKNSPVQVGGRLKNVIKVGEKENTFKPVILTLDVNSELKWRGAAPLGMFTGTHYFRIEKISENSCKLLHGEHFKGWLRGFIMKRIGQQTHEGFISLNKALKARAEAATQA